MARELKRVPLDFNWPLEKIWKGYINPYSSNECNFCGGTGFNPATRKILEAWHNWQYQLTEIETKALLKEGRLLMLTHIPLSTGGWKEKEPKYIPTAEEINKWFQEYPPGHDTINRWICVEARAKYLGVYGTCEHCTDGLVWESEEIKKLHDAWIEVDPPAGEGYQLWETSIEGYPVTPVFTDLEQLCEYCEREKVSGISDSPLNKVQWMQLLTVEDKINSLDLNTVFPQLPKQ